VLEPEQKLGVLAPEPTDGSKVRMGGTQGGKEPGERYVRGV
jgi:hypothetical protein